MNYIIIYSGPHYGRAHRLVSCQGSLLTALHEGTGETVTCLRCDAEPVMGRAGDDARATLSGGAQ